MISINYGNDDKRKKSDMITIAHAYSLWGSEQKYVVDLLDNWSSKVIRAKYNKEKKQLILPKIKPHHFHATLKIIMAPDITIS